MSTFLHVMGYVAPRCYLVASAPAGLATFLLKLYGGKVTAWLLVALVSWGAAAVAAAVVAYKVLVVL